MGKRMKGKARNPRKLQQRSPSVSTHSVAQPSNSIASGGGDEGVMGREPCNHCSKGRAELNQILSRIGYSSSDTVRCEECRMESAKKRVDNENGKEPKKRGGPRAAEASSESDFIWVCMDCNHCYCGGVISISEPYGHARRHAKRENHSWAVRFDSPGICWCFSCNSLVPIEKLQGLDGDVNSAMDVENAGSGGNVEQDMGVENGGEGLISEGMNGYAVRGLMNLGNTCFFNSIMQNLLAMNMLRGYMMSMDEPFGHLTMALKNFFIETSFEDSRGVLNPSTLFDCICVNSPQFTGYQQQDSHELLRFLLDGLHMEEASMRKLSVPSVEHDKGTSSSGATFVDAIFGGQLSSTVSCMECGHTSIVYEPFLDLSLPVPSKKPLSKKVPLSMSKRNRMHMREGNRGSKLREKGVTKGVSATEPRKTESSDSFSECNESCFPGSEKKQNIMMGTEENYIGMDCGGPTAILDTADSVSQNCEVPIVQSSESGQICEGENYINYNLNLQIDVRPMDQLAPSDSCGASSCRDENPSSCTQDSGVLLIPHKEFDSTVEDMTIVNQKAENAASVGSPVKESSVQTTSVVGCEQVEVDFVGFGDLSNEPEITFDIKTGTGMGEERDTTFRAGNSIESNQAEVDHTSAPVSIYSCLALFTKPELLSDEHAWHCERCSENLPRQNVELRRSKRQAVARHDQSEAIKSATDEGEVRNKKPSPSLEVDFMESTVFKVSGNENMITNAKVLDLHMEGLHNTYAEVDVSQKPPSPIGRSSSIICKYGEDTHKKSSESLNPLFSNKASFPDVLQKDEDFAESDHTSQYLSCPSAHEASILQENLGKNDSDSCSTNDRNSVGCGGQDLVVAPCTSEDQTETIPQSSCENDNFSEVNHLGREGSQLLDKVNPANDSEGEEMETESRRVKREATKRILVDRTPPILTIHLKRFNQDARGRLNKLRGHVSFQEILDLRPYMDPRYGEEKCCYHLVGLVEHSGTMKRGHYIAYVKGERSQGNAEKFGSPTWFYASDTQVREVSISEVLHAEAYILFYEKVGF